MNSYYENFLYWHKQGDIHQTEKAMASARAELAERLRVINQHQEVASMLNQAIALMEDLRDKEVQNAIQAARPSDFSHFKR